MVRRYRTGHYSILERDLLYQSLLMEYYDRIGKAFAVLLDANPLKQSALIYTKGMKDIFAKAEKVSQVGPDDKAFNELLKEKYKRLLERSS